MAKEKTQYSLYLNFPDINLIPLSDIFVKHHLLLHLLILELELGIERVGGRERHILNDCYITQEHDTKRQNGVHGQVNERPDVHKEPHIGRIFRLVHHAVEVLVEHTNRVSPAALLAL